MAADVDIRTDISAPDHSRVGEQYRIEIPVDFTTSSNQLAQNEVMSLYTVPQDSLITYAGIKVTTADADVSDMNLGISTDGATDNSLIDALDPSATGWEVSANLSVECTADSQIVLTNIDADTIDEAVIRVVVIILPLLDSTDSYVDNR